LVSKLSGHLTQPYGYKWSMLSGQKNTLSIKLKEIVMSKGQDSKKTDKKKPAKTMKEKRNDKKDKKASK